MTKKTHFLTRGALMLIRLYQKTLSPDHGFFRYRYPHGFCRFSPSCSEYAHQAIGKHGLWRGSRMAAKRIGRCNPFHAGGFDPVK